MKPRSIPTVLPCLLSSLLFAAACASTAPPDLETAVAELDNHACTAVKLEPGVFSTDADEGRLVFSPDGRDAYFHRLVDGVNQIFESHRRGGRWTTPTRVSFATPHTEFDPFVSLDGRTLYYTSFRPLTGSEARPDGDLWKVERRGSGWGEPVHLGPEVNTDANEFFPTVTADGTLFFNSDREGGVGAWDIYRARARRGGYRAAELLPGDVNTGIWEFNPSLSPGGRLLAFGSLDPDPEAPYSDVFFSVRLGGEYSERVAAGPCVNTEVAEYHPTLDLARGRLIFVRADEVTGAGDFYEVSLPGAFWAD